MASVPMHWKDKQSDTNNNNKENTITDQNNEPVRMSKRKGKPQIIKTDNFLIINEHQGQKYLSNDNSFNQISCKFYNINENK
jgi:hypothetical protein